MRLAPGKWRTTDRTIAARLLNMRTLYQKGRHFSSTKFCEFFAIYRVPLTIVMHEAAATWRHDLLQQGGGTGEGEPTLGGVGGCFCQKLIEAAIAFAPIEELTGDVGAGLDRRSSTLAANGDLQTAGQRAEIGR